MRRIALIVCGLMLFGAFAGPASADAKKKKQKPGPVVTVQQQVNVADTEDATAAATCPAGTTVVGGGFSAGPLDPEFLEGVLVRESRMDGNGWRASAVSLSGAGTVTAYAYCRKRTAPLIEAQASVFNCFCTPLIEVVATCPEGTKPIAGGFSGPLTFADGGAIPQSSSRFGAFAWKFVAFDSGSNPSTVTSYAYCRARAALETSGVRVIEGTNATGTAYAPLCKRSNRKMLAGGFETSGFDVLSGTLQMVTSSVRDQGRWATSASEAIFGPGTLQSYGYCA